MACRAADLPGGGRAIVCGGRSRRARCRKCGARAPLLCDYQVKPGKACDSPLCESCACQVGPDRHYCPDHPHADL